MMSFPAVPKRFAVVLCLFFIIISCQEQPDRGGAVLASGARGEQRARHLYELTPDVAELLFLPHVETFYPNDVETLFGYARKVVEDGHRPVNMLPRCSPELVKQERRCEAHDTEVGADVKLDYKHNLKPYRQGNFQFSGSSAGGLDLAVPDIGVTFTVGTPYLMGVVDGKTKRFGCGKKSDEDNVKKSAFVTASREVILNHTCRMFVDWSLAGALEVQFSLKGQKVSVTVFYNGKSAAPKNVRVVLPFFVPEQAGFDTCLTLAKDRKKGTAATPTTLCLTPEEMSNRRLFNGSVAKRIRQVALKGSKYFDVIANTKKINALRWGKEGRLKEAESRQDVLDFEFSCKKQGNNCSSTIEFTFMKEELGTDIRQEVRLLAGFTKHHPEGKKYTEVVRSASVRLFHEKFPFRLQRCELLFAMAMVRPTLSTLNLVLSKLREGQEAMHGWLCEASKGEKDSDMNKNRLFCHLCHMRGLARLISSLDPAVDEVTVHRSVTQLLHRANEIIERHLILVQVQKEQRDKTLAKSLRRDGVKADETMKARVQEVETYIRDIFDSVAATLGVLSGTCRWCRSPMTVNATVIALQVFAPHLTEFDEVYRRRWASEAEIVRNSFPLENAGSASTNKKEHTESACLFPLEYRPQTALTRSLPDLGTVEKSELIKRMSDSILPYAKFMAQRMLRTVVLDGKDFSVFTETEKALDGDNWMWTDDNAKSLEMFVLPGVYERLTSVANGIMNFCLEMMKTDFIIRRTADNPADANLAQFKVEEFDASNFRLHNGLMNFKAIPSVPTGVVQSYRFHDGRDQDITLQLPPIVTIFFDRSGGDKQTFPLDKQEGYRINLASPSSGVISVQMSGVLTRRTGEELASYEYSYFMNSSRTATNHELKLVALPGVELAKVEVRFVTEMTNAATFDRLCSGTDGVIDCLPSLLDVETVFSVEGNKTSDERKKRDAKPPTWIAVLQSGNAGFSYASYTMLGSPAEYRNCAYYATETRGIKRFATHYECSGPVTADHPCVLRETKLLTAGGLYDDMTRYDPLLTKIAKGEDQGMIDYSISYDIGAEVNALAAFYLFATTDSYSIKPTVDLEPVKSTIDRHLRVYFDIFGVMNVHGGYSNVFVRGLAFLIVTLTNMFAATGDNQYMEQLQNAIEMLNRSWLEGTDIFTCMSTEPWSSIDCHTSALFAAARVLGTIPLDRSHPVGDQLEEWLVEHGTEKAFRQANKKEGTPQFELIRWTPDDFLWNFKCGLTNRLVTSEGIVLGKQYKEGDLPEDLRRACVASMNTSTVEYDDAESLRIREIKTSPFSGETNTETQPWAVLGLFGEYVEVLFTLTIREAIEKKTKRIKEKWYRLPETPTSSFWDENVTDQKAENVCPSQSDTAAEQLSSWYGRRRPQVKKSTRKLHSGEEIANPHPTTMAILACIPFGLLAGLYAGLQRRKKKSMRQKRPLRSFATQT